MRRFLLIRNDDVSGISGTGVVAEGLEFSDGTAVMRWLRAPYGLNIYTSVNALIAVHGHEGRTKIQWTDGGNGYD